MSLLGFANLDLGWLFVGPLITILCGVFAKINIILLNSQRSTLKPQLLLRFFRCFIGLIIRLSPTLGIIRTPYK